jgi:hypothetical protein
MHACITSRVIKFLKIANKYLAQDITGTCKNVALKGLI